MILFVYFKFVVAQSPWVEGAVRAIQDDIRREFPDAVVRLMKRPEADEEGRETWMETYELPDSAMPALRARLDELVVARQLPQPRRNEIFLCLDRDDGNRRQMPR